MKKFEPNANYTNTPPIYTQSQQNTQPKGFNINQLLQIIPKLNLNNIFSMFTPTQKTELPPEQEFMPTQNLMRTQNLSQAQKSIQTHREMVTKIHKK